MKVLLFLLFLISCGIQPPTVTDPNPTPTATPTVTPTGKPDPGDKPFRPCVLVEETEMVNVDTSTWKPSYYYNTPNQYPVYFESDGVHFRGSSGYRAGITIDLGDRDVSGCPSLAFRVQGLIKQQTLGGSGYDDREAPLAVMIQYTDSKGVNHNSLSAFNEGESDDRSTTRMYWWGFGYLNPTYDFGYGFTPSISAVKQGERFDITSKDILPKDIKTIHTVTIEASGWALESVLYQFAMKPIEAFANPEAPYENAPNGHTPPIGHNGNTSNDTLGLEGTWKATNPILPYCYRVISFFGDSFDYSQECDPFVDAAYAFRYGTYTVFGDIINLVAAGKDGIATSFLFGTGMVGSGKVSLLPDKVTLMITDSSTDEVVVFSKEMSHHQ